ncbi:MAG TPA: M23 family metallopeptidase [Vicinamibacterales bacterium]|nr:M23 family metallopeptidase [Vicinamibacterales bacterium]
MRAACLIALAACLAGCRAQEPEPARRLPRADIALAAETFTIEARVARDATLESLFRAHDLRADVATAAIEAVRTVFRPSRLLKADHPYRLVRTIDGLLRRFEYHIDADRFLQLEAPDRDQPGQFAVQIIPYRKTTEMAAIHADIDAEHPSLVAAIDAAGEQVQLAIALAEIFAGDVDFHSELQPGDSVELLFEKIFREGEFAGYGDVVAARLLNDGRDLHAYRFAQNGRAGYYDERGRSLRRFMLRSPLRFEARVTSGFSYRRLHPVHRRYRAHLAVDYGAPHGSAVVAVADGTVVSAGHSGASGLMVRLRHASGFESYYLHLSSLGKGIRAGRRVRQNQLIGRVGSTGTATGPHLDYRLRRNGVFVNPLTVHRRMPPGDPIAPKLLAAFDAERERLAQQISTTLLAAGKREARDPVRASQ